MKIRFFSLFWGQEYTNVYLKYSLKCILQMNNRKALINNRYIFYTTKEDFEYIKSNKDFQYLDGLCNVEFFDISIFKGKTTEIINNVFNHSFNECLRTKEVFRHIPCDSVISDGSLINSLNPIKEGEKAVFLPFGAIRILWNAVLDHRSPTQLFREDMHFETKCHFIDSDRFFPHPVQILNEVDGIIYIKSFFCQPLYLMIEKPISFTNVEWDLINNFDLKDVYFINNSNEAFEMALTKPDYERFLWPKNKCNKEKINEMVVSWANDYSIACFEHGYAIL